MTPATDPSALHAGPTPGDEAEGASGGAARLRGVLEFLLVGGVTPLLYPLAWLARRFFGSDPSELAIGFLCFHAAHLVNDPHFSVTYLLFYRDARLRASGGAWGAAQRLRYVVAGFVVPAVLVCWSVFALAARTSLALGLLVQLMFLLVGWHYGKQGFGVLAVLTRRAGVAMGALERRVFLAHAYAAWAYAWASPADPGTELEERGVVYRSLAHGRGLELAALAAFLATGLAVLVVLVRMVLARRRLPPAAAVVGYLSSLWLWTVYSRIEPLVVYVIPALHSVQYLYFVGLLERSRGVATAPNPFAARSSRWRLLGLAITAIGLAWLLFHGAPEILDAMVFPRHGRRLLAGDRGGFGPGPIAAAFFVCVNVHHYFMDHVIWRRENPEMALLRGGPGQ